MTYELITAAGILGALLFYFLYLLLDRKSPPKSKDASTLIPREKKFKQQYSKVTQKSYIGLIRIPILRGYIRKIRLRLETVSAFDEYKLRQETMKIVFVILGSSGFIILLSSLLSRNLLFVFLIILAVMFLTDVLEDVFIHRLEDRLLRQLKDYIAEVRHHFQQTKMVDQAIYEATLVAQHEVKIQTEKIYDILISAEPRLMLRAYEEVAPNRFLKAIAGISVLVMEQGDIITSRGSVFLNALSNLTKEINYEVLRRNKLSYVLKGLSMISLLPVFFTLPLRKWAITYFPVMEPFYNSRFGLISQILLYAGVLLAYSLIRKMREVNELKYNARLKKKLWEEWFLQFTPLRVLVLAFTPKYYKRQYLHYKLLLKEANAPLKLEWLFLRRLLLVLISFLSVLMFFMYSHINAKINVHGITDTTIMMGKLTPDEVIALENEREFDIQVMNHFKGVKEKAYQEVALVVSEQLKRETTDQVVIHTAKRIYDKMHILDSSYLRWWELLLSAFIGFLSYHAPVLVLKFQAYMRKKDMEEEVNQFYTIIQILSEFKSVSVEELLEWMERFSVVFKEPLRHALLNYDSGAEETLEQLKEEVSFAPFTRIVDRLQLSVTRITIKDAFDDLEIEKQFYIEQRKENNDRIIKEKEWWGNLLGMAPLYILIFLYLVIPMIYISLSNTGSLMSQITN
ncbi:hypothetical protein ACFSCX_06545 [Bacillus salitolerans]|uniref:Type II secretion system protein GspF domain-containing protein n=1 Tax=Bacillus salitolerans TaxID=1437434 RepID=A0ABW4LM96_9BACI